MLSAWESTTPEGAALSRGGVLVDMAWHKGVDCLEPGTAITVDDLEAWEEKTGVRVSSGDVLLIRTGRWEAVRQIGQWNFRRECRGLACVSRHVAQSARCGRDRP